MEIIQAQTKEKKDRLCALLEKGAVKLHLNARNPRVQVPHDHKQNQTLVLNVGYEFDHKDFKVGDDQVESTLTFGGVPFFCEIPWEAIFGLLSETENQFVIFPTDMPPAFFTPAVDVKKRLQEIKAKTREKKKLNHLSVVKSENENNQAPSQPTVTPAKILKVTSENKDPKPVSLKKDSPKKRPQLKLIKSD